ncbi:MAG TPA: hypothetical protein EYN58_01105 [Candidatus Poseidoniales archaeon]|nr:MAG: hypothetical protein CXX81_23170 [Euryarchaeota archaeon]HHZ73784.1 hypothetical protein [Candidatus Poseidoniales archaeon]PXY75436.1 MAG: hypothetical protein CXX81_18470 [Euryarchaeota archaeon]PXY78998.1 MAG: hypothetical protein CXX81_05285 [Euryarchaeota archaeon]HIA25374.1 hypothetical protein [Candidatus Poseidoniales archaeon]
MPVGEGPVRTREVYATVIEVLLRDGVLTREEQRLATRLAILLFKKENDLKTLPGEIYNTVIAGDVVNGGEIINKDERLQIYEEMFETAFVNASLSHDEMAVIAILRSGLRITDKEHELAIEIVKGTLEESDDPKLLQKVKEDLAGVIDLVGGMFESLRPKR